MWIIEYGQFEINIPSDSLMFYSYTKGYISPWTAPGLLNTVQQPAITQLSQVTMISQQYLRYNF